MAIVEEACSRLVINDPFVRISSLLDKRSDLLALVDTGSPVSFVKISVYDKYIKPFCKLLAPIKNNLRNLSDQLLDMLGIVKVQNIITTVKRYGISVRFICFEQRLILRRRNIRT